MWSYHSYTLKSPQYSTDLFRFKETCLGLLTDTHFSIFTTLRDLQISFQQSVLLYIFLYPGLRITIFLRKCTEEKWSLSLFSYFQSNVVLEASISCTFDKSLPFFLSLKIGIIYFLVSPNDWDNRLEKAQAFPSPSSSQGHEMYCMLPVKGSAYPFFRLKRNEPFPPFFPFFFAWKGFRWQNIVDSHQPSFLSTRRHTPMPF